MPSIYCRSPPCATAVECRAGQTPKASRQLGATSLARVAYLAGLVLDVDGGVPTVDDANQLLHGDLKWLGRPPHGKGSMYTFVL